MKIALFTTCIFAMMTISLASAQAQERVELIDVGLSLVPPAEWTDTTMSNLSADDPAMAFYHVQVNGTGQSVALHRQECRTTEQQRSWARGDIARNQISENDSLTELPESAPVKFGSHNGFELSAPRENATMRAYSFLWVDEQWCYRADLGAPDELFASSRSDFQQIIDSIRPVD